MEYKEQLNRQRVTAIEEVAPDVYLLRFDARYPFQAGQVVAVDMEEQGEPRLYSIVSGEDDSEMEILFDERPQGKLTPRLSQLKTGSIIWVSEPFGSFTCREDEAWWIAAGTGIAPFVSMIRSGKALGKTLIHGGRMDENFYFSELIEEKIAKENYFRCASQQADSIHYRGRLTAWLREQEHLPTGVKYYLCGSADMVVDVRDLLIAKGVDFQQIISETYY